MRCVVLLAVCCAVLSGCQQPLSSTLGPPAQRYGQSPTPAVGPVEGRTTVGWPMPVPGQTTRIVPVSVERPGRWFGDDDPYSRGGHQRPTHVGIGLRDQWAGRLSGAVRWHNAVLVDHRSGERWRLLERRGVVGWFEILARTEPRADGVEGEDALVTKGMIFLATIEDTDGDGMLTDLDATVAIATRADGREPRAITPANSQVWGIAYDADVNLVYLLVASPDSGGRFRSERAPAPYVFDPDTGGAARPVIDGSTLQRTEALLGR